MAARQVGYVQGFRTMANTNNIAIDFGAASRKARAKLSRKHCAAWAAFNAGAIDYDTAQERIKAAEAVCNDEIEAAYQATDNRPIRCEGDIAQREEVATVSP